MYTKSLILNKAEIHPPSVIDRCPHLEKLWNYEIVWDWGMAIIVDSPEVWLVHKVPYEGNETVIMEEFEEHERFVLALREWKQLWVIPDYIKIPSVRHMPEPWAPYFSLERIDGLTLKSIHIILRDSRLKQHDRKKMLREFSDYKLKDLFVSEILQQEDREEAEEDYDMDYNNRALDIIGEFVYEERKLALEKALNFLASKWCVHHDLHNGNIMIDRKWNIFIIDFWKTLNNESDNSISY